MFNDSDNQVQPTSSRIGILWGGGLGDLLVISPLIVALRKEQRRWPTILTTASHATHLFQELYPDIEVVLLPRRFVRVWSAIQSWRGSFDMLYIGPYPTWKTRVLAHMLAPKRIWCKVYPDVPAFMLEQILRDVSELGLPRTEIKDIVSEVLGISARDVRGISGNGRYLVLHPGAKQGWQTTKWPTERWIELIERILDQTSFSLHILGTENERNFISSLLTCLPEVGKGRINLCLSWRIRDVAELVRGSAGVICHNSGILHLAVLLRKDTICLTGSSASYWRPHYPWVTNLDSGRCHLACNRYRCPIPFYRARCITELSVDNVWQAIGRCIRPFQ